MIGCNLVPSLELRLFLSPATMIHADGFAVRVSKAPVDLLVQASQKGTKYKVAEIRRSILISKNKY